MTDFIPPVSEMDDTYTPRDCVTDCLTWVMATLTALILITEFSPSSEDGPSGVSVFSPYLPAGATETSGG